MLAHDDFKASWEEEARYPDDARGGRKGMVTVRREPRPYAVDGTSEKYVDYPMFLCKELKCRPASR